MRKGWGKEGIGVEGKGRMTRMSRIATKEGNEWRREGQISIAS